MAVRAAPASVAVSVTVRSLRAGCVAIITFAVVGFLGAVIKLYYQYNAEMAEHEANGPWAARRG